MKPIGHDGYPLAFGQTSKIGIFLIIIPLSLIFTFKYPPPLSHFFVAKAMALSLKRLTAFAFLALCWVVAIAELQRLEHAAKADGSLSVMVVGDWGRRGTHNQSKVAVQVIYIHIYIKTFIYFLYSTLVS